jgi:hypothetical protein
MAGTSKPTPAPPASASPEKMKLRLKKFEVKSSLTPKKGSSPTLVYCAGTSFNAVVVWTVHPIDSTKDGFTNPGKIIFRTNREVADSLGVIQVSIFFNWIILFILTGFVTANPSLPFFRSFRGETRVMKTSL